MRAHRFPSEGSGLRVVALSLMLMMGLQALAGDAEIIGMRQPECALQPLGERPLNIPADWHGEAVYIDFWASWCRPCVKAFPFMNELQARYGNAGLHVLAVNLDEEAADAEGFLDQHPAAFALAADREGRCARAWGLLGMPTSYLIDRAGIVREMYQGFRIGDTERIQRDIEAVLADSATEATP